MVVEQGQVLFAHMKSWSKSVPAILDAAELGKKAAGQDLVLIKPNLVEALKPPITTPVALVETVIDYLLDYLPAKNIVIGEGCGSTSYDTFHTFDELGYTGISDRKGIQIIDLNTEKTTQKVNQSCTRWPNIFLPEILDRVFLLSIPVLKAHSLAQVTLTMKNMMGCAPPEHYQGSGGWAKSAFHEEIHRAIFDLNQYRTPDFTILDASIGMAQAHLSGPHCNPPVGKIAVSSDPVAIDSYGAALLGKRWQDIEHIAMAHGILGNADLLSVKEIG